MVNMSLSNVDNMQFHIFRVQHQTVLTETFILTALAAQLSETF